MEIAQEQIITIVTPSYNQGEFLDRTLNSIITQSGPFYIDLIVMDGGSKDNSVGIIEEYANLIHSGELSGRFEELSFRTLKDQEVKKQIALELVIGGSLRKTTGKHMLSTKDGS